MDVTPVIINRYPGKCNNPACRKWTKEQEGFSQKIGGRWVVWCKEHVPQRIQAQTVSAPIRRLTAEGYVITPYEPQNLPLIKSLPGAKFHPNKEVCRLCNKKHDLPFWSVSLDTADRRRILEVADELKLDVDKSLRTVDDTSIKTCAPSDIDTSKLYPFQVVGANWLHDRIKSRRNSLLGDDMGLGKAGAVDSLLYTPHGPIRMGDVQVGDEVIGSQGLPVKVIGVYPQGVLPTYKITFTDGTSTETSDDHLWAVNTPVRNRRGNPYQVKRLADIRNKLRDGAGNLRHFIPIVKAVEFKEQPISLNSYLLGFILANGSITQHSVQVTIPDQESVVRLGLLIPCDHTIRYRERMDYIIACDDKKNNTVKQALTDLGLWGKPAEQKHVPASYLYNTLAVRWNLLQGLMDGDGSVTVADNHVEYTTVSEQLAKDVQFLVQSMGGTARVNLKPEPKFTYKGETKIGMPSYRVSIALPKGIEPFRLKRKADVYRPRSKYQPMRAIESVEYVGDKECQCIAVDSPDHLYATDGFVLTHNTIQTLMALPKESKVLVVAPAGLKYNWREEIVGNEDTGKQGWRPDFTVSVMEGRNAWRSPKAGEVIITNYDILPGWLEPPSRTNPKTRRPMTWAEYKPKLDAFRQELKRQHPELADVILIGDEVHKVKNYKAARSKKMQELVQIVAVTVALTGTPLDNRPEDLYGVLSSLGMNFQVFGTWEKYLTLFNAMKDRWGGISWGRPQPIVPELLRRVMLRRKRTEVLPDLPTKTYTTLVVNNISKELQADMDELWEEVGGVLEVTGAKDPLPPFEMFSSIRQRLAQERIEAVKEYVEDAEEQEVPLVVFSAHLAPIHALAKREGWKVITSDTKPEERQRIVSEFQAGRLKGVGVTIRAGGVGLTLTHAWKALFVDLDWNPGSNWQAEDRVCRIGQTSNTVEIVRMVCNHPLDKHVQRLLQWKIAMVQSAIEDSVQAKVPSINGKTVSYQEETEEEFQARMKRVTEEAEAKLLENAKTEAKGSEQLSRNLGKSTE